MAISPHLADVRRRVGHTILQIPSVAAVIHDERGRVLFQRRSDDGQWSLPAGAIDLGETPLAALEREVMEETGLVVTRALLLDVYGGKDFRFVYPNGDEVEYVVAVYRCAVGSDVAGPGAETSELAWFDVDSLPQLALPYPRVIFELPAE